jgi:hypothetical protein
LVEAIEVRRDDGAICDFSQPTSTPSFEEVSKKTKIWTWHGDVARKNAGSCAIGCPRADPPWSNTMMPTTATVQTDKLVNGDTSTQIQCCVRQEEATAFPAAHRISADILFHPPTVHPTGGASSTGEVSRGAFAEGRRAQQTNSEVMLTAIWLFADYFSAIQKPA